jgi:DNA polymerase-3 subunit epsilon
MRQQPDQPRYLEQLIIASTKPSYRIRAVGTPFAAKNALKERRYRWDPEVRCWWTTVTHDNLTAEEAWLADLYEQYNSQHRPDICEIEPTQRWA